VSEEERTFPARVVPVRVPAGAEPVMLPVRLPVTLPVIEVAKRLVVEAVVAKKLVEVLLVEVEFKRVMFWKVDEALRRRFERLVRPAVAVRVPVKLAVLEIVWPLMRPEVRVPRLAVVAKRLVLKKLVEVAEVVVALVVIRSVRPFRVVRLFKVVVPARAVSKRAWV